MDSEQLRRQIAATIASTQLAAIIQQQGAQTDPKEMDRQAHLSLQYTRFLLNHLETLQQR